MLHRHLAVMAQRQCADDTIGDLYTPELAVRMGNEGACAVGICYCDDHFYNRHATPDSYLGSVPRDIVWLVCQFLQDADYVVEP